MYDALGLGAAKVDTAYAGTEAVVDVLSEYKSRLVAAKEDGVDKSKIQTELSQLNAQIESIVGSSSFSGVNRLKIGEPRHFSEAGEPRSSLVSSFVRSNDGAVAVKQIDVELRDISMLNSGGGGILQKDVGGVGDIGGFSDADMNVSAHNGHEIHEFTGPVTFGSTDFIEFTVVIDAFRTDPGATFADLRIDKSVVDAALGTTDGSINNASDMTTVLQHVFSTSTVPAWAVNPPGYTLFGATATQYEIGSLEMSAHIGSSIDIVSVTSDFGGVHPASFALGLEDAPRPDEITTT